MKMKLLTVLVLASTGSMAFAADAQKGSGFNEDDISTYHLLEKESVGNKSMDNILSTYHKEFQKRLKSINKEMDAYQASVEKDVYINIKEGEENIVSTEKLYLKNCSGEIKEEEVFNQCQQLKESIFNDQEKIKSLEIEKKNFQNKIATDRKNRLKGLYVNYKNLVGKSKAEYEAKK